MNVYSAEEMYSKISKIIDDKKSGLKANRIAIKPLALPRNWTKVLRLGPASKMSIEEIFEVITSKTNVKKKSFEWNFVCQNVLC